MKVILFLIFSLFFISSVSVVTAQEQTNVFFIMIQIIQRDSDGTLITYIENDNVTEVNYNLINLVLNDLTTNGDYSKFFKINDKNAQIVSVSTPLTTDPSGLLATVKFQLTDNNGIVYDVVRFSHDGMRLNPDEHIEVIWTFMRFI